MDRGALLFRYRGWVPVPAILAAIVLAHPRLPLVTAGGILMALGEGIRLWAAAHLGRTARSSRPRASRLVTGGPYARTRHPLYWGNFLLTAGFLLVAAPPAPFIVVALLLFVPLYRTHALREEALLEATFPEAWRRWTASVPRWRWRLRPARVPGAGAEEAPGVSRALGVEALTLNAEFWLLLAVWLRTRFG